MLFIIDSAHKEFLSNTLKISSSYFDSYSKINFKGTDYQVGNYVTNFRNEVCLYEILEIVLIKNNAISFIVHQIQL